MGQQQLLLILLGVIIVGIAVVVGINVFDAQSENSTKDAIISDCITIGSLAQQYYKKPHAMGGGGNSFDATTYSGSGTAPPAFTIPDKLRITLNGEYGINALANYIANAPQTCDIVGFPLLELRTEYTWSVICRVTPTGMTTEVIE